MVAQTFIAAPLAAAGGTASPAAVRAEGGVVWAGRRPGPRHVVVAGGPAVSPQASVASVGSGTAAAAAAAIAAAGVGLGRRRRQRRLQQRGRGAQVARRATETTSGEEDFFFEPWACHLQELLHLPELGLREQPLPAHLSQTEGSGKGSKSAEIRGQVFVGGGGDMQSGSSPARRYRVALVRNGEQLQAFNAVLYPSYELGPLPILGVDVLSFNNHQRLLFGVDWAPMKTSAEYAEEYITPHVAQVRQKHAALLLEPSGKFYGEAPEFFSPQIFFSRPSGPEALSPGDTLWEVFEEYCSRYVQMLHTAKARGAVSEEASSLAKRRQAAFDTWHAERDPAVPVFKRLFGESWTDEYVHKVLFPGAKVRTINEGAVAA